jgi:nucleotide-binding universal stress UspA family protein
MSAAEEHHQRDGAPMRVLLAVHGYEPPGWAPEACRVVAKFGHAVVRVLAVLDVPCPAFTSLTPQAARAYGEARDAWTRDEEVRIQGVLDRMARCLPRGADVVRIPSRRGDLAGTIAEYASEWAVDVAVVGAPPPGVRRWFWPGPVHERVLRRLPCAVMVIPPPAESSGSPARRIAAPRMLRPWRRPAAASQGA